MPKGRVARKAHSTTNATGSSDRRRRVAAALGDMLEALGVSNRQDLAGAASRAAGLWTNYLLAGEGVDLPTVLGRGIVSDSATPVSVLDIGVHLVCPHHLTVAFGKAHIAYAPRSRLVGLGKISELARVCTARFVLQEDASKDICRALVDALEARAAVALIEATHPCHNIPQARAHGARVVTWGAHGQAAAARELKELVLTGLRAQDSAGSP